jgi:hypothetical protein
MKLVIDNPMQVPTKSANKARGASPFFIAKSTGEGGAKNSAVRDFQRFLEAREATQTPCPLETFLTTWNANTKGI